MRWSLGRLETAFTVLIEKNGLFLHDLDHLHLSRDDIQLFLDLDEESLHCTFALFIRQAYKALYAGQIGGETLAFLSLARLLLFDIVVVLLVCRVEFAIIAVWFTVGQCLRPISKPVFLQQILFTLAAKLALLHQS